MASQNNAFPYTRLHTNEIRLLVLLPVSRDQQIRCNLATVKLKLQEHEEAPVYHALSYMWGPSQPTTRIQVNYSSFEVRHNLFNALRQLHYEYFPRCLWVDAICINQNDNTERGAQVSIMSDIFRAATKVLAWLGTASDNSDMAFETLASVRGNLGLLRGMAETWRKAGVNITDYDSNPVEAALFMICKRPYWRRVWIIQEILSAASVDVLCGSKVLGLAEFWTGVQCIANINIASSDTGEACMSTPAYQIAKKAALQCQRFAIEDLIVLCSVCNSQCEDIRDRIYGLLSLSEDLKIVPDYSKSTLELYLDVAQAHYLNCKFFSKRSILGPGTCLSDLECPAIETARNLLDDPPWDSERELFLTNDPSSRRSLPERLREKVFEIQVHAFGRIGEVGPVISTAASLNETIVQLREAGGLGSKYPAYIEAFLSELKKQDYHRTATIGEKYCSNSAVRPIFVRDKQQRKEGRLGFNGRYRMFYRADKLYWSFGIASSETQRGDICCMVPCFG